MSTATAESQGFFQKYHFILRRLQSLTGIVPIGMFVMFHLFTNMQMIFKPLGLGDEFHHEVEWIHNTIPALWFVEIFGLWIPIFFHAGLGIIYTFSGSNNLRNYKYEGNVRYVLQRVTGMLAFVFIFLHIATLRWGWNIFGWYTPFYVHGHTPEGTEVALSSPSLAIALQGGVDQNLALAIFVSALYIIGVYAAVFHWANGLWTAAITWGATTTTQSMKRWGYVCIAIGLALSFFTAAGLVGAWTYQLTDDELAAYRNEMNKGEQAVQVENDAHDAADLNTETH